MSDTRLSRVYLETLPSADLIALADDLGIDIPENLNRRFIIGELLEVAADLAGDDGDDLEDSGQADSAASPETYNETVVSAVLRNPVWLFVYWDVNKGHILRARTSAGVCSLGLRVSMFSKDSPEAAADSFDVPVSVEDRNRYVLLPSGFGSVRVDLVLDIGDDTHEVLAGTGMVSLPLVPERISNPLPETPVSPVLRLSSLPDLLRTHYTNHRQSFF